MHKQLLAIITTLFLSGLLLAVFVDVAYAALFLQPTPIVSVNEFFLSGGNGDNFDCVGTVCSGSMEGTGGRAGFIADFQYITDSIGMLFELNFNTSTPPDDVRIVIGTVADNYQNVPANSTFCYTDPEYETVISTTYGCDYMRLVFWEVLRAVDGDLVVVNNAIGISETFSLDVSQWQQIITGTLPPTPTPTPTATPTITPTATPPPAGTPQPPDGVIIIGDDGEPQIIPVSQGNDLVCYSCPSPNSVFDIGAWLAKLTCVIINLFTCLLRIWLLNIENTIFGLLNYFVQWFDWLVLTGQQFTNYFLALINVVLEQIVLMYNSFINGFTQYLYDIVTNIFNSELVQSIATSITIGSIYLEIFLELGRAIFTMIIDLYNELLELLTIIFNFIQIVVDAIWSEAFIITDETNVGVITFTDLQIEGPTPQKAVFIFLLALSTADYAIGAIGIESLQVVLIGILSWQIITWTINKWHEIIPT